MEGGRAVIAAVSSRMAIELKPILASAGYETVGYAANGMEAIRLVNDLAPSLLLADAVLPGADGVQLANHVLSAPLSRYPGIILMVHPGYALPGLKTLMPCGVTALFKPVDPTALAKAISELDPERRSLPQAKAAKLSAILEALGVPDHRGRSYLAHAAGLAWMDSSYARSLKGRLYPAVALRFDATPAQVERAMRYAIDYAWKTGEIERQHEIFGDTIDARRGKPTCGEMIAQLADILRWEGRP